MEKSDLLPSDAFEQLPEAPEAAFLKLLHILEENFEYYLALENSKSHSLRREFSQHVAAIASELGIEEISVPENVNYDEPFDEFKSKVAGIKTKITLRSKILRDPGSVALNRDTKLRIEEEIERLRDIIENSDLPQTKKDALGSKLDELLEELRRKKLSLAKLLVIAGGIASLLGGSASALANAPEAYKTVINIIEWVGTEKAAEDKNQLRLPPPPMALPRPTASDTPNADIGKDS